MPKNEPKEYDGFRYDKWTDRPVYTAKAEDVLRQARASVPHELPEKQEPGRLHRPGVPKPTFIDGPLIGLATGYTYRGRPISYEEHCLRSVEHARRSAERNAMIFGSSDELFYGDDQPRKRSPWPIWLGVAYTVGCIALGWGAANVLAYLINK